MQLSNYARNKDNNPWLMTNKVKRSHTHIISDPPFFSTMPLARSLLPILTACTVQ